MTTDKAIAQWTIDALVQAEVKTIVFSPGSRNAPLIIAAEALGTFEMIVLGDERSAAFHALGRSQVTGTPVAVCCTSGSALANYYPAVLEAYYAHVPLIVLSADRPETASIKARDRPACSGSFTSHMWRRAFRLMRRIPTIRYKRPFNMPFKPCTLKCAPSI